MKKISELFAKVLPKSIKEKYLNGTDRSKLLVKNVLVSLVMKAANIISTLLIVPLTINYVNPTRYGIWLTLSSVIGWLTFFDLGLGNGFRNRFAEAKAQGNLQLAREYLSTTYVAIGLIVTFVFTIIVIANQFIDWSAFLNVDSEYRLELTRVFDIVCIFTGISMVANVFSTLLTADQNPGAASVIHAIGQYLTLFVIWILTMVTEGSLISLAFYYSGIPCIIMIVVSIYMFSKSRYKFYAPRIKNVKFRLVKDVMQLGVQFFFIYLCMIAIFQIINLIITREVGPLGVTQYTIANKYFNIIFMVLIVILTPFWSAFTDAYSNRDFKWMRNMLKHMERLWFVSVFVGVVMLLLSSFVYKIWIGSSVQISISLSFFMLLLVLMQSLSNIYMYMINGIGYVRIQLTIYIIFAILAWPSFTYFVHEYGLVGITFVPSSVYLIQAIFGKIQISKLLNDTATGWWKK